MHYAIVCSGQGAQNLQLFQTLPFGQRATSLSHRVMQLPSLPDDIRRWLAAPDTDPGLIYRNRYAQPFLCLFQACIWAELSSLLPRPYLIAGYSLGELGACHCAGVLSAEDMVSLAAERAQLMDDAAPEGGMMAVTGLPLEETSSAIEGLGYIAIVICDRHQVVGFPLKNETAVHDALTRAGACEIRRLPLSVASHTPLLQAAVAPFREAFFRRSPTAPSVRLISGVNAAPMNQVSQISVLLPDQISHPVRWDMVMDRIYTSGCRVILEIGAGNQLSNMFRNAYPDAEARSVTEFHTFAGVATWLERRLQP